MKELDLEKGLRKEAEQLRKQQLKDSIIDNGGAYFRDGDELPQELTPELIQELFNGDFYG